MTSGSRGGSTPPVAGGDADPSFFAPLASCLGLSELAAGWLAGLLLFAAVFLALLFALDRCEQSRRKREMQWRMERDDRRDERRRERQQDRARERERHHTASTTTTLLVPVGSMFPSMGTMGAGAGSGSHGMLQAVDSAGGLPMGVPVAGHARPVCADDPEDLKMSPSSSRGRSRIRGLTATSRHGPGSPQSGVSSGRSRSGSSRSSRSRSSRSSRSRSCSSRSSRSHSSRSHSSRSSRSHSSRSDGRHLGLTADRDCDSHVSSDGVYADDGR